MGKKHAVVLELGNRTATVLQPDGRFSKVPLRAGMSVGDVVSVSTGMRRPWMTMAAAAAMVVVMLYTSFVVLPANKVMAYVTVDAAPGVELAVNARGKVVGATAVTADGEQLLLSIANPKGSLTETVAQLTTAALASGHMPQEDEVIVVTVAPAHNGVKDKQLSKIEQVADEAVQRVLTTKQSKATTGRIKLTPEVRDEAKKEGLPPGLYVIALKAADEGVEVNFDELRGDDAVDVLKSRGAQIKEVMERAKAERSLNDLLERVRGKLRGRSNGDDEDKNGYDHKDNSERQPGGKRPNPSRKAPVNRSKGFPGRKGGE